MYIFISDSFLEFLLSLLSFIYLYINLYQAQNTYICIYTNIYIKAYIIKYIFAIIILKKPLFLDQFRIREMNSLFYFHLLIF